MAMAQDTLMFHGRSSTRNESEMASVANFVAASVNKQQQAQVLRDTHIFSVCQQSLDLHTPRLGKDKMPNSEDTFIITPLPPLILTHRNCQLVNGTRKENEFHGMGFAHKKKNLRCGIKVLHMLRSPNMLISTKLRAMWPGISSIGPIDDRQRDKKKKKKSGPQYIILLVTASWMQEDPLCSALSAHKHIHSKASC